MRRLDALIHYAWRGGKFGIFAKTIQCAAKYTTNTLYAFTACLKDCICRAAAAESKFSQRSCPIPSLLSLLFSGSPFRWRAVHQRKEAISVQLLPVARSKGLPDRRRMRRQASSDDDVQCGSLANSVAKASAARRVPARLWLSVGWLAKLQCLSFLLSRSSLLPSP